MVDNEDLAFWADRTRRFGEASVGYGCSERAIYWDNMLRAQAISRLVTINAGMRVLDVGTGTGYWAIEYARVGATVVALEFCDEVLQIARAKARQAGVEINWLHSAVEEANLLGNFDIALSITCLQHITERERQTQAIRHILRSLKPSGVFVLLEDTIVGDYRPRNYIGKYSQQGWIDLVQSQGGRILDFVGVSFLRFPRRIPLLLSAGVDYALGRIPCFKARATVTAFAFGPSSPV